MAEWRWGQSEDFEAAEASFRAALEIHEDPVAESSAGEKAQREG